jgi:phosphonate transport system substrate-binding protein
MPFLKSLTMPALAGFAAIGLLVQGAPATAQEDCPRGDLDERYCDRNGDLVADAPSDESKWVDPDTLIFAYTPVEDPAVYKEAWSDFLVHMEKVTGKKVLFFPVQSNAAQIEAMRSGRLHVAGFNTGSNPLAVNCAGFVSFTIMASLNGDYGYSMEIISYPGSGIEKVEDIKGRTLAFTVRHDPRPGLQDHLLGQARQLDSRRGQQGLRRRLDRQFGQVPDDQARRDQGG